MRLQREGPRKSVWTQPLCVSGLGGGPCRAGGEGGTLPTHCHPAVVAEATVDGPMAAPDPERLPWAQ